MVRIFFSNLVEGELKFERASRSSTPRSVHRHSPSHVPPDQPNRGPLARGHHSPGSPPLPPPPRAPGDDAAQGLLQLRYAPRSAHLRASQFPHPQNPNSLRLPFPPPQMRGPPSGASGSAPPPALPRPSSRPTTPTIPTPPRPRTATRTRTAPRLPTGPEEP